MNILIKPLNTYFLPKLLDLIVNSGQQQQNMNREEFQSFSYLSSKSAIFLTIEISEIVDNLMLFSSN